MSSFFPASTRQTILIVDDAPENLTILGELLMPSYQVRVARSGIRALQVAASAPQPDLLLLDVMMPEMDGYAVLTRLRDNPATRAIPVIFVTAMDSTEDESHGLELGAVDYITKPIRPAIVLARVRTHLELKQARDWLTNQNACLEAEVVRRMRENQLIEDVSIRALAALAEVRDPDTGNHLRRTQIYVKVLANALANHPRFAHALSQPCRDLLVKSAPLHDIGKVGIPDHILLKPGRLTPEEREIMKGHCRIGSNAIEMAMNNTLVSEEVHLLDMPSHGCANKLDRAHNWPRHAPLEFLYVAREIALSHHEHWDGTGYPDGLAQEDIPISARLMALADAFDALISRRIYKPPLPMAQVIEIIREERGRQFDPDIVDAFLSMAVEFQAIAEHYADSEADICAKLVSLQGQSVGRMPSVA